MAIYMVGQLEYIISMEGIPPSQPLQTTIMTQATTRPTTAQIQRNQAQADRKAAALLRRAARGNGLETVAQQNARLYANIGR